MFVWIDNQLQLAIFEHTMSQYLWKPLNKKLLQYSGWMYLDTNHKTWKWSSVEFPISSRNTFKLKHLWKFGPDFEKLRKLNHLREVV